jgi:hypothetical protein
MKTSNLFKTIAPLFLVLVMTACQKGDSGSAAPQTGLGWFNCPSCQGVVAGSNLLNAVQSATPENSVQFSLNLNGQIAQPCYQQPVKYVLCAAGPASMTGYMRILQQGAVCGAPAGDYIVRPLTVSQISNATLFGGQFEAVGPGNFRIVFSLDKGILYNYDGGGLSSASPNNRVSMGLVLQSVGGYSCGIMTTD